jgi:hypothetical protein
MVDPENLVFAQTAQDVAMPASAVSFAAAS